MLPFASFCFRTRTPVDPCVGQVALPDADALGLAVGSTLWAVGCGPMMLLGDSGKLVTLDQPSLLPPNSEWLGANRATKGECDSSLA